MENFKKIQPNDVIDVTVKVNGVPFIFEKNKAVKETKTGKRKLTFTERLKELFTGEQSPVMVEDNVDFSKTVRKTLWDKVSPWVLPYIDDNMVVYGEVVGYIDEDTYIKDHYDYGCNQGECKLMIYHIETIEDGIKREWQAREIYHWVRKLRDSHIELRDKIINLNILFHGTAKNIMPELTDAENWHDEIIPNLYDLWKINALEPLCKNDVIREGVYIRYINKPITESFVIESEYFTEQ